MNIGTLALKSQLFLAPLAGYTGLPFRLVVRQLGGLGMATTDLVNARSLLERRPAGLRLIETRDDDKPLAVQLFGSVPEEMRDAAQYLENQGVVCVDINMGCPVRKVCMVGGGSAMLTDWQKSTQLVKGIVEAVSIPVTVKMRLGWDAQNITAPLLAKSLEDVGVKAITIHGRTREQGFSGPVNLAGIRDVVKAVHHIPVIGNGNVVTPVDAKRMLDQTGCSGISIGRGAFYNPWIFRHIQEFFTSGIVPDEPAFSERIYFMQKHLDYMVEVYGEIKACKMFRKIAPLYTHRMGPAKEFNRRIFRMNTRNEFLEALAFFTEWRKQFLDENGQLKKPYQPTALSESFSETGGESPIALPKGPSEFW
jgi:nifR3 family TIM-barrel protein